jgi:CRISPR-associated endonuclease Cas1
MKISPKNQSRGRKIPLWLPYVQDITVKKESVCIVYKGGSFDGKWSSIHSIMFYGGVCDLSEKFLDTCRKYKIPLCIHRRNMSSSVLIIPSISSRVEDVLSQQIIFRNNKKKSVHIAKRILQAKFNSMTWLQPYPEWFDGKYLSIKEMRNIEAWHAHEYWKKYYDGLGFSKTSRRSKHNDLTTALDAVSKFLSGIVLRWITYHHLSPHHGFLHETTDYPALVYDLMEPYRGYFDKAVWTSFKKLTEKNDKEVDFTAAAVAAVEDMLDMDVFTGSTRQIVSAQELIHGSVLALRAYLLGDAVRFMPPEPEKPNGGRPKKAGYRLYGRSAGQTDFWETAKKLAVHT